MENNIEDMSKRAEELANEIKKEPINEPSAELKPKPYETIPKYTYDVQKTIDENANDLAELAGTQEALKDTNFIKDVANTKKEQIKESAKANAEIHSVKKETEKVKAITDNDIAYYEQHKGILEWGGVKEPTTKRMTIFLLFLIIPFFTLAKIFITMPIAIVKTLFKAINELLNEIMAFGKIARSIAFTILVLGVMALVVYIILFYLEKYGIINWF